MNQAGNCRHCGSPLYEGMKFCGHCGKPAEQVLTEQNRQPDRMQQPQRQTQKSGGMQQPRRQTQRSDGMQQVRRERPEAGNTAYDPNTYENRVRRRRNRSGDEQSTDPGLRFHDAQSAYQDRQFYDERIVQQNQRTAQQKQRYRQEELERDWQQSWERERMEDEDDGRFTPIQYVLTGIAVILLMHWLDLVFTGFLAEAPAIQHADRSRIIYQQRTCRPMEYRQRALLTLRFWMVRRTKIQKPIHRK